jgi:hypothetical protein
MEKGRDSVEMAGDSANGSTLAPIFDILWIWKAPIPGRQFRTFMLK